MTETSAAAEEMPGQESGNTPGTRGGGGWAQRAYDDVWRQHRVDLICSLMVVLVFAVGFATTPHFLTASNTLNIVRAAAATGIAALGVAMITMSGNYFSLSISATATLCGIVFAGASNGANDVVVAFVAALAAGSLLGFVQGALVGLGANPIITTLAFNGALFGLAAVVTGSQVVTIKSGAAVLIATANPDGIPIQAIVFVALIVAGSFFLSRTSLGRTILLVGSKADRVRRRAQCLCGGRHCIHHFRAHGSGRWDILGRAGGRG